MKGHRRRSLVRAALPVNRTRPYPPNECASPGADLGPLLDLLVAAHESAEPIATRFHRFDRSEQTFARLYALLHEQSRRWKQ